MNIPFVAHSAGEDESTRSQSTGPNAQCGERNIDHLYVIAGCSITSYLSKHLNYISATVMVLLTQHLQKQI